MLKYLLYSKKKFQLLVYKKHIFSNNKKNPYMFNLCLKCAKPYTLQTDKNTSNNLIKTVFQTGSACASREHELTRGCMELHKSREMRYGLPQQTCPRSPGAVDTHPASHQLISTGRRRSLNPVCFICKFCG